MTSKMTAGRYARALYDVADESGEMADVKKDMERVREVFQKLPALRSYCFNRSISVGNALKIIDIAFSGQVTAKTETTFRIMVKNGRVSSLPFVPDAFFNVCEDHGNIVHVIVEFASKPDESVLADIKEKMQNKLGKQVFLEPKVDPAILGGFRINWARRIIDNSAIGRIRQFSQVLRAI